MKAKIWEVLTWNPSTRLWESRYVSLGKRIAMVTASSLRNRGFRVKIELHKDTKENHS